MEQLSEKQIEVLSERKAEINKILEALEGLSKNRDWQVMNDLVFSKSTESIERELKNKSLEPTVNVNDIYRLQGALGVARRLMDIPSFIRTLKIELDSVNKKLESINNKL